MAPKTEGIVTNVRIPEDLLARIDARAALAGNSRSETIRRMLAYAIDAPTQKGLR